MSVSGFTVAVYDEDEPEITCGCNGRGWTHLGCQFNNTELAGDCSLPPLRHVSESQQRLKFQEMTPCLCTKCVSPPGWTPLCRGGVGGLIGFRCRTCEVSLCPPAASLHFHVKLEETIQTQIIYLDADCATLGYFCPASASVQVWHGVSTHCRVNTLWGLVVLLQVGTGLPAGTAATTTATPFIWTHREAAVDCFLNVSGCCSNEHFFFLHNVPVSGRRSRGGGLKMDSANQPGPLSSCLKCLVSVCPPPHHVLIWRDTVF